MPSLLVSHEILQAVSWIICLPETSFHDKSRKRIKMQKAIDFLFVYSLTPSSVELEHTLPPGVLIFHSSFPLSSPNSRQLHVVTLNSKVVYSLVIVTLACQALRDHARVPECYDVYYVVRRLLCCKALATL